MIRYIINLLFFTIFVHCIVIHENYNDGYSCPIDLVPPHSIHWYFCGNFPKGLFDHATAYAQCILSAYSIQSMELMFNNENKMQFRRMPIIKLFLCGTHTFIFLPPPFYSIIHAI